MSSIFFSIGQNETWEPANGLSTKSFAETEMRGKKEDKLKLQTSISMVRMLTYTTHDLMQKDCLKDIEEHTT